MILAAACGGDHSRTDGSFPAVLVPVASGLTSPLFITAPPGDTSRLFIVEQPGRIRIVQGDSLLTTPFLDIHDSVSHSDEQGLLGLAFAPDFATSGTFYVHTTATNGDIRILRYKANPSTANTVSLATRVEILRFAHPFANHNSGMLAFGSDGYLYIGSGDGGGGGDPENTGQDPSDLLAGILRIDVSGDSAGYAIPPGNPFVGDSGYAPELWAYGLRNPWRFSFDRTTHDLWIGDVGQNQWEEVDHVPAGVGGQNYGWSTVEGTHCFSPSSGCTTAGITMPVLEYNHLGRCAVVGGYVYRGSLPAEISGLYLYGDLCDGQIRVYDPLSHFSTLGTGSGILTFGEDARGELYVGLADGTIKRILPMPPPIGATDP